jgi:hypothetical protein
MQPIRCDCNGLRLRRESGMETPQKKGYDGRIIARKDGAANMNTSEHSGHDQPLSSNSEESIGAQDLEESRKIRRLQLMISMVMSVISQDSSLTLEEASTLAADAKRAALALFPDKELAYDLLYKPRLQRLMRERFRLQ